MPQPIESESGIYPIEIESKNGDDPDVFRSLTVKIKEAEGKSAPVPFSRYLQDVIVKLEQDAAYNPISHPADVLARAITAYGQEEDEAGRIKYHFFTRRDDRYAVYGNIYPLGLIVESIRERTGRTPGFGKAILLLAPTGAGKSTIIDGLEVGYEEYTRSKESIYTIKGCPYQDNPLLLLPLEAREELKTRYNLSIEGDVCPHCQKTIQSSKTIFDVQIAPIQFSVDHGIGIVRLPQEVTANFDRTKVQDEIIDRMLRANNGILEVAELFLHPPSFLKTLMGVIRERRIQKGGITYYPQFVVLTHATRNDLRRFEALVSAQKIEVDASAFMQRLNIIHIPYILSQKDEVLLYLKALEQSGYTPHVSPQTLEKVSMVALASRLTKSNIAGVDIDVKIRIYNGENTKTITQKDRERIEVEGRENNEGISGISPVQMIELLSHALKENPSCINPVRTLQAIEVYLRQQPQDYPRKAELLTTIKNQLTIYADWLERTVKRAFRGDYEEACEKLFQEYLDQVDLYALREKVLDPHTGEYMEANERFLRNVETFLGISENAKREFREKLSMRMMEKVRNRDMKVKPLSYTEFDDIKEGLEKMVTGESEQDINSILLSLLGVPNEKRITLEVPDEKKRKRLEEAKLALVEKYGFCQHCAPEMIVFTVRTVNEKVKR